MSPALRALSSDVGLLILRLMIAAIGVFHGGQKLFGLFGGGGLAPFAQYLEKLGAPLPSVSAALAGGAEFFGGILIGLGLLTRLASLPFLFTMGVAVTVAHPDAFDVRQGGMEFALSVAAMLACVLLTGPGRISVDALIFGRKRAA